MRKPFYNLQNFSAGNSFGYLVRRIHSLTLPRVEARFADQELTFSHWVALMSLRDGIADTCAEIARHLNHDSGATTRLVDQLEARGLVTRNRSTSDRRVVHLALTDEGRAVALKLTPQLIGFWNAALDEFSREEATQLMTLLQKLLARIESMPVNDETATKSQAAE